MEKFNERLKEAMQIRNISQSELSKKTNVSKSSISQYLSGYYKPKQDRIGQFAKVLKVNEAWLMGYDVPMEQAKNNAEQIYYDFVGINTILSDFPTTNVDVLNTKVINDALNKTMEINQMILSTPRIYATSLTSDEAVIGLKYLLAYYHINLSHYDDNEFREIVETPLFKNFIKNMLPQTE